MPEHDEQPEPDARVPRHPLQPAIGRGRPTVPYVGDLVGIPYEFLGRAQDGKAATIDCMGVVLEVYRRAGREKSDPFADGADPVVASMEWIPVDPNPTSWPPLAVLQLSEEDDQSGLATHLAVYLGAGLVIHATEESGVVVESVSQLTGSVISVVIGAECKIPW